MTCLDDDQIAAFAGGTLGDAERARVLAHLDECDACLAITSAVSRTVDPEAGTIESGNAATAPGGDAGSMPATVGRYALRELIGQGAMGSVYVAHDPQLDREVALKIVRSERFAEAAVRARLSREARAMAKVSHANVVAVYDAGELDDGVFIAMELVRGSTLAEWIAAGHPWRETIAMFLAVGRGLAAAHAAGVVHRDFKPQNVLVDQRGRAAVGDFGLALRPEGKPAIGASLADVRVAELGDLVKTRTGALIGTPSYMSPEQYRGEALDARSDQFSFGVALFEALYGARPFRGATLGELRDAVLKAPRAEVPADSAVPKEVLRVIDGALGREPAARFPDLPAMLGALEHAAFRTELPSTEARGRAVWFVLAVGAITAFVFVGRSHDAPKAPTPPTPPVAGSNAGSAHGILDSVPPPPAAPPRTAVLVPRVTAPAGDARFDGALEIAIAAALSRSTKLDAYSGVLLTNMAQDLGDLPPKPTIDDLGTLLAAHDKRPVAIVRAAIAPDGAGFALTAQLAWSAGAHADPPALATHAADLDGVMAAAIDLGNLVRAQLGDPSTDSPADHISLSRSLPAVRALAAGQRASFAGDENGAVALYQQAIAADPDYTEAHAILGVAFYNLQRVEESAAELRIATQHAERMAERERLRLWGDYYAASGQYLDAVASYQRILAKWPGDARTEIDMTSTAIDGASWPLALELARQAANDHVDLEQARRNVIIAELATGDFAGAARDGAALLADFPRAPKYGFQQTAMAQVLAGHRANALATLELLGPVDAEGKDEALADLAIYEGRLADAEPKLQVWIAKYAAANNPGGARTEQIALAHVKLRRGDKAGALAAARAAAGDSSPRINYAIASLAAEAGEPRPAHALAAAFATQPGPDARMYGLLAEGDALLAEGKPKDAVARFTDALRLHDVWLGHARLGAAHLAAGNFDKAIAELEGCIARRGEAAVLLTPSLALLPPVYLDLARAKDGAHRPDAADAYRAVLALGDSHEKDAIADAARARLAK